MIAWVLGCAAPDPARVDEQRVAERLSLDLRGVRPSVAELEALADGRRSLDDLTDELLADPRFAERVREAWGAVLDTRRDRWTADAADFGLVDEVAFARAVGEEPLRVIERVAAEDLPWTDVVTAEWTRVDPSLAAAWPVDDPGGGEGWRTAHYTDGRPSAGVLSTNGLWWRYTSTDGNRNRGRANAISRSLLCHDYLEREIVFDRDVDLLDEEAVDEAVRTAPACVACHVTLDPVAAYLFGFYRPVEDSPLELATYHAERERKWEEGLGVAPAWYGAPGSSLADLGRQIAGDERFVACAVERTFSWLAHRAPGLGDTEELTALREAFLDGGLAQRPLARAMVGSAAYRDGGPRVLDPTQLASVIEDLTGYRLTFGGVDPLAAGEGGLRELVGAGEPSATSLLVVERVAEAAASFVVAADLAGEPRLFTVAPPDTDALADPDRAAEQIRALHLRLFGDRVAADGPEVEAGLALWGELHAIAGDPVEAWTGLVTAMLRDPELVVY